jgi:hypothetical protein
MYCEKMAFRQRAVIEFVVKERISEGVIYERLRSAYGDVCMGASSVRRWVKLLRTETGMSPIGRAAVERELLQLKATSKKSTSSSDETEGYKSEEFQRSLEWGTLRSWRWRLWDIGKFVPVGFPVCLRVQRNTRLGTALSSILQSDLASSNYHLFGPLKDHLRGHHYETDEEVQKAV